MEKKLGSRPLWPKQLLNEHLAKKKKALPHTINDFFFKCHEVIHLKMN